MVRLRSCVDFLQVRILLSRSAKLSVSYTSIPPVPFEVLYPSSLPIHPLNPPTWVFYVASSVTAPSLFTKHKTTFRRAYDEARADLPAPPDDAGTTAEVLLYNERDEIMEGSITTPYFWRDGGWVTPCERCGGNVGTSRRLALGRKVAREGIVRKQDLRVGEVVWCSNAVRGFGWGYVDGVLGG